VKRPFKMRTQDYLHLIYALTVVTTNIEAKPKSKAEAEPKPWDWQNEQLNYPVYNPYPLSLKKTIEPEFLAVPVESSVGLDATAYLPCRVKNLGKDYTVSWIRAKDLTVLSVGESTFSSDWRISVVKVNRPRLSASDWTLVISNATKDDAGFYECQVNTDPKLNKKNYLEVRDQSDQQKDAPYNQPSSEPTEEYQKTHSIVKKHHKKEEIESDEGFSMYLHENGCLCPKPEFKMHQDFSHDEREIEPQLTVGGSAIQYVTQGEDFELTCSSEGFRGSGGHIFWKKDKKILSGRSRAMMSTEIERLPSKSVSTVYLSKARLADTGNYTCSSDSGKHETVIVVVLPGEYQQPRTERRKMKTNSAISLAQSIVKILLFSVLTLLTLNEIN